MPRIVDRLVQDGLDTPIDVVVDPTDQDLVDVRHRRLCHHWRMARRERDGVPASGDLNPGFLAEIDDYLVLLVKRGDDLHYLRFGRGLVKAYGRDMTGLSVDDFPTLIGQLFRSVYRLSEAYRVPVFSQHKPPPSVTVDYWLRLVVPLDETGSGRTITGFLVCSIPIGAETA